MSAGKGKITAIDTRIGQNLRAMRKSAGMSQKEVAAILGITFQQLQKYEKGVNRVPAAKLYILARSFNIPLESFFHGIEPGPAPGVNAITANPLTVPIIRQLHGLDDRALIEQLCRVIEIFRAVSSNNDPEERELS